MAVLFRTWSFFQQKITKRWWTDILLPRSLSLASLFRITCCCYAFMSCPYDSMVIQLLAARISWPPVTLASVWPRGRSRCRRPHRQEIRVFYVTSSCDIISRDLFLCDSSLFSVERISENIQLLSKSNQTSTLFPPTCEKWVHSKNWFLRKKFVKNFTFGSGCTVTAARCLYPFWEFNVNDLSLSSLLVNRTFFVETWDW